MQARRSVRGRWVAGIVVLTMAVVFLGLATMASMAASPISGEIQPAPVPTPAPAQPTTAKIPAAIVARPAPAPVPTPPSDTPMTSAQPGASPPLFLLTLPAVAATGLGVLRRQARPFGKAANLGARATVTLCRECG